MQIAFEILCELGLHRINETFTQKPNPWLAAIVCALFGTLAGAVSLCVFPNLFISSYQGRLINLSVTPVLSGCTMTVLGAWRARRGQDPIRLDRFSYGYLFALAMAAIRFHFGN